ncbi:unnamed protein product [Paramecium sonneborni]|uniref:Vesicle transport protein GOT1B n=1 Tax=Paramecium sonneborni TaxID=65129 RepID=A0A8S1M9U5_9CILI|nr:unnamed protein product [Paramecium sonneborni]
MGFLTVSLLLFILGVMFFLDRALLVMGNLSFMIGLCLLIGIKSTLSFFLKKGKIKGSIFFFLGFFIIVIFRTSIIGFPLQIYGLFQMFKSFLPFLYDSATKLPIIGRYLRNPQLKKMVDEVSAKGPSV